MDYTHKTEIKTGFVCKSTISNKYSKKKIFTDEEYAVVRYAVRFLSDIAEQGIALAIR